MRFSSGLHVPEIFRDGLHRPRDDFWERISTDKYFLHIFCPFGIRWNPFSGLTDPLTPILYRKTGVCRGIPVSLIFDPNIHLGTR